ncbi:MAG: CPBP family intramembrane metalloprotease [Acidobacteria bacterium]|nr:CPBP family intramembrane metalloprotease [Acidobacteriota bacterium]
MSEPSASPQPAGKIAPDDSGKNPLIGIDGKLRPIWRALIFVVAGALLGPVLGTPFFILGNWLGIAPGLTPGGIGLGELSNFTIALVTTGAFALYERRRIDSYGLPVNRAMSRETVEGLIAGVLMAGAVGLGMLLLGAMQVGGLALYGSDVFFAALAWLVANICIGVAEEFWFRSYLQITLWESIGFWPASIVIALIFAALHYFFKPDENVWDVITLISISLLLSYSLLRTGTLWFAVGFHIAFDYMQLFVIGTPNGGRVPAKHLLNTSFHGPAWLTGGPLGTEASWLMYPMIAPLWIYVWRRWRGPLRAARR